MSTPALMAAMYVISQTPAAAGVCEMTYMAAIKAGVDIVDTSMSPLSNGTAQPSTQALNTALKGTKFDPKLNLTAIHEAEPIVTAIVDKYLKNGLLNPKSFEINPNILKYQVPGGMLSNLIMIKFESIPPGT